MPAERREASLGGRGAMTAAGPVRYARWDNLDDGPSASIGLAGLPGSPTVHSPDASPPRVSSSGRGLTMTGLDPYAVLAFEIGLPA